MIRLLLVSLALSLAGCGVDAIGTAAVTAQAKAREAEQAKKLKENMQKQLNEAMEAEQRRLDEVDAAMENERGDAGQ